MVAFLAALPSFIAALPYIFQVLVKIMALIERFSAWAKEQNFEAWLNDIEDTIDRLEKAKTPTEKREAARSVVDIIRRL
jgi:biopolymer transport protein ExbB/TolQ